VCAVAALSAQAEGLEQAVPGAARDVNLSTEPLDADAYLQTRHWELLHSAQARRSRLGVP
jgi:hypothetical protein